MSRCPQALFGELRWDVTVLTVLYSLAGLGIAIVNDFKSIDGDRCELGCCFARCCKVHAPLPRSFVFMVHRASLWPCDSHRASD